MINKVLIAEDHESASISVQKTLEELGIVVIDYVYYCDDALQRIKNAIYQQQSYDLLITDLYFEEDKNTQLIVGGAALITAARQEQPDLKVLVFSAESRSAIIEKLFSKYEIDGYVRKARNDAKELKNAFTNLAKNKSYFPRHLQQSLIEKNAYEFTSYEITIISLLAEGMRITEIPEYLEQNQIRPSRKSSIEKCLKHLKEELEISTKEQLIAYCKDIGII